MRNPDEFDAFYKDARDRLLLQTYALTGDLPASRAAVRDAFVVAWHHWRKVSRLEDPEAWVRPHAWAHAQRRHTARLWHRDKGLDPEVRATLDALGKLAGHPAQGAAAHPADHGLDGRHGPRGRAPARRRRARAADRDRPVRACTATSRPPASAPLFEALRRARRDRALAAARPSCAGPGAARRRTHTAVGAVAAVAALVLTGSLVTDAAGVRPTLDRDAASTARPARPRRRRRSRRRPDAPPDRRPSCRRTRCSRRTRSRRTSAAGSWTVRATTDNTAGDGLVLPCQQERYADPRGTAALVRTFATDAAPGRRRPRRASRRPGRPRSPAARGRAQRAYDTHPRLVRRVHRRAGPAALHAPRRRRRRRGDAARAALLGRPGDHHGRRRGPHRAADHHDRPTRLAAAPSTPDAGAPPGCSATAVDGLCDLPGRRARARSGPGSRDGRAAARRRGARHAHRGRPAAGRRAWTGPGSAPSPRRPSSNVAATGCDRADFSAAPMTNNLTRSFLVPGRRAARQFGLTETVGSLPAGAAAGVRRARPGPDRRLPDKELGTEVTALRQVRTERTDLTVWQRDHRDHRQATVELPDGRSSATARRSPRSASSRTAGRRWRPTPSSRSSHRALDRLSALPPPAHG